MCCKIMGEYSLKEMENKPKFIFFSGIREYWNVANEDLYHNKDVFVCDGIKIPFPGIMNSGRDIWRWEKIKRIPFKRLLYGLNTGTPFFDKEKVQYAVFPENNSISFSNRYLSCLRAGYPNLVMIFEFSNVCGKYNNLNRLNRVIHLYDHVLTFNEADSKKYGFTFHRLCYSFRKPEESAFPYSDVLFIGKNKNRLPCLLSIYDRLTQLGLKCNFLITGVPPGKQIAREGIIYSKWMPYREVLQHVSHTKCILEILEDRNNYSSLRTFEALVFGKKLITANAGILRDPFYSPSQILYIESAKDITKEFFETPVVNNYDIAALSPDAKLKEFLKLGRTKP